MNIHPTHACFDDAMEILEMMVTHDPRLSRGREMLLVHGILLNPEGEPYAHAWIEHAGTATQAGVIDGAKVRWRLKVRDYYREMRVQETTKYSVKEVLRENLKHATYGPWKRRYLELCRNFKGQTSSSKTPEEAST